MLIAVPLYFEPVLTSAAPLLCWAYASNKWIRSWKSGADRPPNWRMAMTIAALLLSGVSTGLSVFLLWHAAFTGGYPFYHPVEMFCIRVGFVTALLALLTGPLGQRKQRFVVTTASGVNLLLWFTDAMAQ